MFVSAQQTITASLDKVKTNGNRLEKVLKHFFAVCACVCVSHCGQIFVSVWYLFSAIVFLCLKKKKNVLTFHRVQYVCGSLTCPRLLLPSAYRLAVGNYQTVYLHHDFVDAFPGTHGREHQGTESPRGQ